MSYTQFKGNLVTLEETHYYPFGLKHGSYYTSVTQKVVKKQVGDINNLLEQADNELKIKPTTNTAYKYKYQGQELEEELGKNTYAYQWRDYDPAIARFNKIDRFAEKYQSMSPYHFSANNPVIFREIAGDSINVTDLQNNNLAGLNTLNNDLESKTGLSISTNTNGNLEYGTQKGFLGIKRAKVTRDANGKKIGSRLARRKLRKAIKNKKTITVKNNTGGDNYVPSLGTNEINFDMTEINMLMGAASTDLNSSTVGPALVFLHELGHTGVGGSRDDPNKNPEKVPGKNTRVINRMRRQLGKNYGVRATYGTISVGGNHYMPFSKQTKKQLKKRVNPTIQYLKF
jgi:RHS repeat-associated protein